MKEFISSILLFFNKGVYVQFHFKSSFFIWFRVVFLVMQDVDSELALHLKRLARKDPTTKVKLVHLCVFLTLKDLISIHVWW